MVTTARTLVAGTLVSLVCLALLPSASYASSPTIYARDDAGTKAAGAQYKDLTNQLCVINYQYPVSAYTATAKIRTLGGSFVTQLNGTAGDPWKCTGNLGSLLGEDNQYELVVIENDHPDGNLRESTTFFS